MLKQQLLQIWIILTPRRLFFEHMLKLCKITRISSQLLLSDKAQHFPQLIPLHSSYTECALLQHPVSFFFDLTHIIIKEKGRIGIALLRFVFRVIYDFSKEDQTEGFLPQNKLQQYDEPILLLSYPNDLINFDSRFIQSHFNLAQKNVAYIMAAHKLGYLLCSDSNALTWRSFRICLRLESPIQSTQGSGKWILRLFIQAKDDPSLMISLNDFRNYSSHPKLGIYLDQRFFGIESFIHTQIVGLVPNFSPLHRIITPNLKTHITLTTPQAFLFLNSVCPIFRQIKKNIGIIVPNWWGKKDHQLGLSLNLKSSYHHGSNPEEISFGFTSIVEYDWKISIGSYSLTEKEFENLVALKLPIVQFRGEWVEMDPKEIEIIIRFMKDHTSYLQKTQTKSHLRNQSTSTSKSNILRLQEAIQLATGAKKLNNSVRIVSVQTDSHLKNLLDSILHLSNGNEITIPSTFHGHLRSYQKAGVTWMNMLRKCELGACLADDMGLGKTIQIIALLTHDLCEPNPALANNRTKTNQNQSMLHSNGFSSSNHITHKNKNTKQTNRSDRNPKTSECSLIICPISLLGNWSKEIARFAPSLRVYISYGATNLTMKNISEITTNYDVVLTSYSRVSQTPRSFTQVYWRNLIVDEAQNIKNPGAKQTKAIKSIPARYRIALTGTPVENHLTELWSIFDFINPGYLGTLHDFQHTFSSPIEQSNDLEQLEILKKLIEPFVLRRVKTDPNIIQDLPPKEEIKHSSTLTTEQASLYKAVVDDMMNQYTTLEGIQLRGMILGSLTKLKQICNHPSQFLHEKKPACYVQSTFEDSEIDTFTQRSGKLQILCDILEPILLKDERVLIFTQYTEMGAILQTYIRSLFHHEALFLNGSLSQPERENLLEKFNSPNGPKVFILSLKAGGTGLNLTRANHVIHFDRWWNPAVEDQATDRAYRIGQHQMVHVHKIICRGTLEEKIDALIEKKKGLSASLLSLNDSWFTRLSYSEIQNLVSLRESQITSTTPECPDCPESIASLYA